jgi:hypothetical protein
MNWNDLTGKYHKQTFPHECRLSSLPEEWQRELAAIWRLEADVNNGGYLQFLVNWGRETYVYASQALKKFGARKMAKIIGRCQALVDEHFDFVIASQEQMQNLLPNVEIGGDGELTPDPSFPDSIINHINELSYDFMDYLDDLALLGSKYYGPFLQG